MHIDRENLIQIIACIIKSNSHGNTTTEYRESLRNALKMCQVIITSSDPESFFYNLGLELKDQNWTNNQIRYFNKITSELNKIAHAPQSLKDLIQSLDFEDPKSMGKFQAHCALTFGLLPKTFKDFVNLINNF